MSEAPPARPSNGIRRGVLLTSSGAVVSLFFLFLETVLAVRVLSPGHYGIYVLLVALVNFLIVLIDLGCKTAVTQMIAGAEGPARVTIVGTALAFRLLVIGAISAALLASRGWLLARDPSPGVLLYLGHLPLMLAGASLDELCGGMLQATRAYRRLALAQAGRGLLRLCLSAILLRAGLGVLALVYSWIISSLVATAYQLIALPVAKRLSLDPALLRGILKFGAPVQLTRLLWLVFRRVDVLLLGVLAGPSSAAFYEVAARIPDALLRLSESFIAVYFPTMSALLKAGNYRDAAWTLNQSLRMLSFVAAVGALVAVLGSRRIMLLLFSERYVVSGTAFALLMLAFHMTFVVNLMGYTLTSAGHPARALAQNVARSALNVAGDLLLIPLYGFAGPAVATLAAVYLVNPLGVHLLRRSGLGVELRPFVTQTLTLLGCSALFWALGVEGVLYKLGIVALFVAANVALGSVAWGDVRLLVPDSVSRRLGKLKESRPYGQ